MAQIRAQMQASQAEAGAPKAGAASAGRTGALASKRTQVLSLVAIGAGAITLGAAYATMRPTAPAPVAAAIEEQEKPFVPKGNPEGQVFSSVEQCIKSELVAASECQALALQAEKNHEQVAVGHDTLAECEREYGPNKCGNPKHAEEPRRRSMFIPLMAAYALGRAAGGGLKSTPLYSHPSDGPNRFRQSAGMPAYMSNAKAAEQLRASERAAAAQKTAATTPAKRGGFGASASASNSASS